MAHIRGWQRLACSAAVGAAMMLVGCAQLSEPSAPVAEQQAAQPKAPGVTDLQFDLGTWRWIRNPDGRQLLTHTSLTKCFIDPAPDQDFQDPDFKLKRESKTFGTTRYDVVNVYDGPDFWSAVYMRSGTAKPLLAVYADGACRQAAESVLNSYEKAPGPPLR